MRQCLISSINKMKRRAMQRNASRCSKGATRCDQRLITVLSQFPCTNNTAYFVAPIQKPKPIHRPPICHYQALACFCPIAKEEKKLPASPCIFQRVIKGLPVSFLLSFSLPLKIQPNPVSDIKIDKTTRHFLLLGSYWSPGDDRP